MALDKLVKRFKRQFNYTIEALVVELLQLVDDINGWIDKLDTVISNGLNLKVDRAGDTMTGDLEISKVAGIAGEFNLSTNGVSRWAVRKNGTPEGGANSGSDFRLIRFDDAGAQLPNAFELSRATGELYLPIGWIRFPLIANPSADPNIFDDYREASYVPTWIGSITNPVLNDGSITAQYLKLAQFTHVEIVIIMGAATTFGSGFWTIGLPILAFNVWSATGGGGHALDSSAGQRWSVEILSNTSAFVPFQALNPMVPIGSTVPFTWAVNDTFTVNLNYRSAA